MRQIRGKNHKPESYERLLYEIIYLQITWAKNNIQAFDYIINQYIKNECDDWYYDFLING